MSYLVHLFSLRASSGRAILFSLLLCACLILKAEPFPAGETSANDPIVFVTTSDVHFGAQSKKMTVEQLLIEARERPVKIARLIGTDLTPELVKTTGWSGPLPLPRGLLIAGDLTDNHKELNVRQQQWSWFADAYPWSGLNAGNSKLQVFPGLGNHDGDVAGPQRRGFQSYLDRISERGLIANRSTEQRHYALRWGRLHVLHLNLCAADGTDPTEPFRFGRQGAGSWNDPEGAFTFMSRYLRDHVGTSGEPVVLIMHYGFDSFSIDWSWWTTAQRAALYRTIEPYQVAAIIHGHNHLAAHYIWPDPLLHSADMKAIFGNNPPHQFKHYEVFSNGGICWWFRLEARRLVAVHYDEKGWNPKLTTVVPLTTPAPVRPTYEVRNPREDESRRESPRFVARWPAAAAFTVPESEVNNALATLEEALDFYLERTGFPSPFPPGLKRTKISVYIVDKPIAHGSGLDGYPQMTLGVTRLRGRKTLAHELAHCLQYTSGGFRDSKWVGWFWESHANWMAHQFCPTAPCSWDQLINSPHLAYGTTRNRYGNWHFLDYLRMHGGNDAVNSLWSGSPRPDDESRHRIDPFLVIKKVQGWTQDQLNDHFGQWALENVGHVIDPEGYYRNEALKSADGPRARYREVRLTMDPDQAGTYRIPGYWAPQRFGYNKVRLRAQATGIITIDFEGLPAIADKPAVGGWRWGVVAMRDDGAARLSEVQRSAKGRLEFPIQSGDQEFYLVVLAAPPAHEQVAWDQPYDTIARFPWRVGLTGATPVLGNTAPVNGNGAPHPNGGGWVAATAKVDSTAFIGQDAQVLDQACVTGYARLEDCAVVSAKATVSDHAVVRDHAYITGAATVSGSALVGAATIIYGKQTIITDQAVVKTVMNAIVDKTVSGTAELFGDVELHRSVNSGRFSGIIPP